MIKIISIAMCFVAACAAASFPMIEYAGGLSGFPLCVGAFPAQIIPLLIQLFAIAALIIFLIRAVRNKSAKGVVAICLVVAIACFFCDWFISPVQFFKAGFRVRIHRTISPEELRTLARVARAEIPMGNISFRPGEGILPSPGKGSLWEEAEHRKMWDAVTNQTAIGKLDPGLVVCVSSNDVELSWGGALVGHWGLRIQDVAPHGEVHFNWADDQYGAKQNDRPAIEKADALAPDISIFMAE